VVIALKAPVESVNPPVKIAFYSFIIWVNAS
jgi:hypothetical protein